MPCPIKGKGKSGKKIKSIGYLKLCLVYKKRGKEERRGRRIEFRSIGDDRGRRNNNIE